MRNWINRNDKMFLNVKDIVNKYDPMGIYLGFNEDEYEPEIIDILNRCKSIKDFEKFKGEIINIFAYWFNRALINDEDIYKMAKDLWEVFNNN
ncbi:DUF1871 family protein [Caloramator sp. mosi_1]|uniref:DUF1871 family protein n=1 Tax=Caloramator sp. mosi_1 TaxID=3023090 RepID=UPI0023601B28|nr:DUF1871 family protein [Caloramator sp. mosi_1]WDC85108.1 DUF1871 family protein [Caloramator sp. mosi_1]